MSDLAKPGRAQHCFEDRLWGGFDAAVAVGASGADEALPASSALTAVAEVAGAELRAVVGGDLLQLPAGGGELRATRCSSSRVWRARGLRSLVCSSAQT
jgi:hypothetical protein